MSELAISIHGLSKSYGRIQALRGLDLSVQEGEIFGFLGPNGAGKTTMIRCLLGLIYPQQGDIRVLGFDPLRDPVEVRARCGYLPGELNVDDNTIEGLNAGGILGLLGFGLLFIVLAGWRFQRRDLRVSGEGSWPGWMQSPFGHRRA
jgi:ABC-type lipopolysaccharide export system ATPase subunit